MDWYKTIDNIWQRVSSNSKSFAHLLNPNSTKKKMAPVRKPKYQVRTLHCTHTYMSTQNLILSQPPIDLYLQLYTYGLLPVTFAFTIVYVDFPLTLFMFLLLVNFWIYNCVDMDVHATTRPYSILVFIFQFLSFGVCG